MVGNLQEELTYAVFMAPLAAHLLLASPTGAPKDVDLPQPIWYLFPCN